MKQADIEYVVCYWSWEPHADEHNQERFWTLVETYATNGIGTPLTTPRNTYGDRVHDMGESDKWLFTGVRPNDFRGREAIPGRCVTEWSWHWGPRIAGFHPPEMPKWLDPNHFDKLFHPGNNSFNCIVDGGWLLYATAKEAHKLVLAAP